MLPSYRVRADEKNIAVALRSQLHSANGRGGLVSKEILHACKDAREDKVP